MSFTQKPTQCNATPWDSGNEKKEVAHSNITTIDRAGAPKETPGRKLI